MRVFHILFASLILSASSTLAWHLGDVWLAHKNASKAEAVPHEAAIRHAVAYSDPDFDFQLAVPAGWTPVVGLSEQHDDRDGLLIAHSVSFEAPREGLNDEFSDYVMIEIIPGSRSGQFITDGSRARPVTIDGLSGIRESLRVDEHVVGDTNLDLVIHQAEIRAVGYTVGFFAIGEPQNRKLIDDAFELMIRTFNFSLPPYRVSQGLVASAYRVG